MGTDDDSGINRIGLDYEESIFKANQYYIRNAELKTNLCKFNTSSINSFKTYSDSAVINANLYSLNKENLSFTGPNIALKGESRGSVFEQINKAELEGIASVEGYARFATVGTDAKLDGSLFMISNNRIQGPKLDAEVNVSAALAETGGNFVVGDPDILGVKGDAKVSAVSGEAKVATNFEAFDIGFDPLTGSYICTPPGFSGEAGAEASIAKGEASISAGNEFASIKGKVEGVALKASASAEAQADFMEGDIYVHAEAGAAILEGEVSSGFNILGLDTEIALKGEALAVGVEGGIGVKDDCIEIDISAALGLGAGASIKIDYSGIKDAVIDFWDKIW